MASSDVHVSTCTRRLCRGCRPCREQQQHSDVRPGPFIDRVRHSLWGETEKSGMHPRVHHDRACRQHHSPQHARKTHEVEGRDGADLGTINQCWRPRERARSLVQYAAAFVTVQHSASSCESGNYQLTFLHRLTLFETVLWCQAPERAIASHRIA